MTGPFLSATETPVPAPIDVVTPMVDAIVANPLFLAVVVLAIFVNAFSPPAKRRRRR